MKVTEFKNNITEKSDYTLLMIPGSACMKETLFELADKIANTEAFNEILITELPFHELEKTYNSEVDGPVSLGLYVDELHKLIDSLSNKNLIVMGHSLGGTLALAAASFKFLPQIKGIISLSGAAKYTEIYTDKDLSMLAIGNNSLSDTDTAFGKIWKELADFTELAGIPHHIPIALEDYKIDCSVNLLDYIGDVKVPVLLIRGENDIICTSLSMSNTSCRLQYADSVTIKSCDHGAVLMEGGAETVALKIQAWLTCSL